MEQKPAKLHTNRLVDETSPYLLQHAHNPVDWYPWGEEAFERARRENKPIFLSVGYSTCYWCHVMERQCFENETVAAVMNEKFINIKVDREERPDVDQLYMMAVQVLTRHGGWPMSVWLTPDLRPFYGGTYFPPTDMHGRPGFVTVLNALDDAFKNRKSEVAQSTTQLHEILEQLSQPTPSTSTFTLDEKAIEALIHRSTADYDQDEGGFGDAPKFPRETLLELALTYLAEPFASADKASVQTLQSKILHTLDAMALGGIRDQLGGGFHRYSTDAKWLVPHFEIMLYDNAMLGWSYAESHRQTGNRFHGEVARGVFDFVLREMTSPDGAFYTALDAEVDAQEGMPYIWTAEEVRAALIGQPGPGEGSPFSDLEARRFLAVYGLADGPNFADPQYGSGQPEKNVLHMKDRQAIEAEPELFARMRQRLKQIRDSRKQPLLDTKIITSWNALMIRALAHGGSALHEQRYVEAAVRAARFILEHHRDNQGRLQRASRDGKAKYLGFLDDYAFFCQALVAVRDATGDEQWLKHARDVARMMNSQFGDPSRGGFFFSSADASDLIVRQKISSDSPLPSGTGSAAIALLALGETERVRQTLSLFGLQLRGQAEGMSALLQAALLYVRQHGPLDIGAQAAATASIERPISPDKLAEQVVELRVESISPLEYVVHATILPGFHINASQAAKGLVATVMTVYPADVKSIDYPPGELRSLGYLDEPVRLYERTLAIRVVLQSPAGQETKVLLRYQACDESACLPPTTKIVSLLKG